MVNSIFDENENYIETEYDCEDFSPKGFQDLIKDIKDQNYLEALSTRDLAEKIGMEYELFRKTVNQNKPTKKRDFIIALGIALNANEGQINELLEHYRFMSPLNSKNLRDEFICRKVNSLGNNISIFEMNKELRKNGFEELDIQNRRNGKKAKKAKKQKAKIYRVINNKVKTRIGEYNCYGDQYNSLCTTYDPERCECYGIMTVEKIKDKAKFQLVSDGKDNTFVKDEEDLLIRKYNLGDENSFICFKNKIKYLYDCVSLQLDSKQSRRDVVGYVAGNYNHVLKMRFVKSWGQLGHMMMISNEDFLTMVSICQRTSNKMIPERGIQISDLFEEMRKRGLCMDGKTKQYFIDYLIQINLIDSKCDSEEAQYVKRIQ